MKQYFCTRHNTKVEAEGCRLRWLRGQCRRVSRADCRPECVRLYAREIKEGIANGEKARTQA